jgi:hypothetical protein
VDAAQYSMIGSTMRQGSADFVGADEQCWVAEQRVEDHRS